MEPAYGPNPELEYVVAEIVDAKGRLVPTADNTLSFSIDGDARILATGSPDPTDPSGYTRPVRKASQGRVLAVIRKGAAPCRLTVKSKGLKTAVLPL